MCVASLSSLPVTPDRFTRSLPARSTRCSFDVNSEVRTCRGRGYVSQGEGEKCKGRGEPKPFLLPAVTPAPCEPRRCY